MLQDIKYEIVLNVCGISKTVALSVFVFFFSWQKYRQNGDLQTVYSNLYIET